MLLTLWLLFFDRNDVFYQYERYQSVKKLEAEANYFKNEIARNKKEGEEFARERYLMKKDNEDIFLLVEDSLEKK